MQIITAAIIKGGTAKTTTCAAIAQAAAHAGKKVLAVDLDPQANLTFALGADQNQRGGYQLLTGTPAAELIQTTEQSIDVIPASPDLAAITTSTGSAKRLQTALAPVKASYDLIVIDTPPQMGELTYNALQAATGLIVPLEAEAYSLQGLYQITDIARQMQRSNPDLDILGVVITRYNGRSNIAKYMSNVIADKGEEIGAPLLAIVRAGVSVIEAAALQLSLFEYAPNSNPARDYKTLYDKIMEE